MVMIIMMVVMAMMVVMINGDYCNGGFDIFLSFFLDGK
jgi:hypothetical protein